MYKTNLGYLIAISLLFLISTIGVSQSKEATIPSVFLDCQTRCDFVYIKQEIDYINYVRDRQVADVYILATSQSAAAGTREVQMVFEGIGNYVGIQDTLVFYWEANVSDAADREIFVKQMKKGLLPYLMKAGLADQIDYTVNMDDVSVDEVLEADPWNYWSFNVGANANLDGEESYNEMDLSGRMSAQRVTEEKKITFFSRYNYQRSQFRLTDGEEFESIISRFFLFSEYVISLTPHWSYGFRADIGSSSFGNTDIDGSFTPAIEYNVYPYSDASTKRFSFLYSIGPEYNDYTDITIFDKLKQTVIRQGLRIEYEQTQKWGDISIDGRFRQFLHDLSLYSVQVNPNIELNIVKGLRLDFGGYIEYVGDRINIAKSDITDEDILLQIKQLNTSYSYYTYVGFNYRFGTQRNNIVNPRF